MKRLLRVLFLLVPVPAALSQPADSGGDAALIEDIGVADGDYAFPDDEASGGDSDGGFLSDIDDLDALFSDAEDTQEAVVTENVSAGTNYNVQIGSIKFPIEVSGRMSTKLGAAGFIENDNPEANFYFDFKNYIYFTTRPDKYLALKGVLKSAMPEDGADREKSALYLYELYFDYLLLNRIYITGGKKKSVWGNIRLFSNFDDYEDDLDALYTNILYDSREYISGIIRVPFGNHSLNVLAMYDEKIGTSPKTKDMSFAGSAEFILFRTSVNFFARRFPLSSSDAEGKQLPIVGLELKRTLFGFDVYGQSMARISDDDGSKLKSLFTSKFTDRRIVNRLISTGGIYRSWTEFTPNFGFIFEFQNIYRQSASNSGSHYVNRFAFDFGMSKLGKNRNIKLGLQWNHSISDRSGFIKTGVILSRVMPHCDWENGLEYRYNDGIASFDSYKITVSTYIKINLDY